MRDVHTMRTTINLDDDVLRAARELASLSGRSLGRVVSDLVRTALSAERRDITVRNGVPVLAPTAEGGLVSPEDVRELLDNDPSSG